jgi:[protein-PII] uridylyltransferase
MAVDNFLVQDPLGRRSWRKPARRLETRSAMRWPTGSSWCRSSPRGRSPARAPRPSTCARGEFDNKASNRFTVIEVNARDRPALLNRLARALFEAR